MESGKPICGMRWQRCEAHIGGFICDLNTQTVEQTVVEVTILPLFDIFSEILILTKRDMKRQGKSLDQSSLSGIDGLEDGHEQKDYYLKFLAEELESGQFEVRQRRQCGYFHGMKKISCTGSHGCGGFLQLS